MRTVLLDPLRGLCQKRRRELLVGRGRAGDDARFRGDEHAVRAVHLLRRRLGFCRRVRAPDLHQMEHRGAGHRQVDPVAGGRVPVYYRGLHRIPGLFRLPHIRLQGARTHRRVTAGRDRMITDCDSRKKISIHL